MFKKEWILSMNDKEIVDMYFSYREDIAAASDDLDLEEALSTYHQIGDEIDKRGLL